MESLTDGSCKSGGHGLCDAALEVLKNTVRLGLSATRANQGSLLLLDENGAKLRFEFVVSRGGLAAYERTFEGMRGKTVDVGAGITGLAASERRVKWSTPKDFFSRVDGDGSPNAVMAVPMLDKGTLVGVMTAISFDRERSFSEKEANVYLEYAGVAAFIVGRLTHVR